MSSMQQQLAKLDCWSFTCNRIAKYGSWTGHEDIVLGRHFSKLYISHKTL